MKLKVGLSAVLGFAFGLVTYFILRCIGDSDALAFSIIGGLLFYLGLFCFLLIHGEMMDRRYTKFEKELTSPVFYKTNGNFNLGNGKIKNGNIYFCEAGIVCVCLDEKPYTLDEILLRDIERYQFDDIHFNIFTKDGRVFVLSMPDVEKVINVLKKKDWI